MKVYKDINSNLEALKLKEIEKTIYENITDEVVLPKIIPFKGVYSDMLYIKNNSVLFVKFMDTTEDVFMLLGEEILEILKEEYNTLKENMDEKFPHISFNYVFVFPYISGELDDIDVSDFDLEKLIFEEEAEKLSKDITVLDKYISGSNKEIELSLFLYSICNEYYVLTNELNLNKEFKKIYFNSEEIEYRLCMMENEQIRDVNSINYGNELIEGGSGTGKSSLILSRLIKLSKIYPHHRFLLLTYTKQQANKYNEIIEILKADGKNIEVFTLSSFIFRLAKVNNLVINYDLLKKNYDKSFQNIIKQIENTVENKRMYKGVFIDESENFTPEELKLVLKFLYNTKNISNISMCRAYNINNNLNIFSDNIGEIEFNNKIQLKNNYIQGEGILDFVNGYCNKANKYIDSLNKNMPKDLFLNTKNKVRGNESVSIIRVEDLDDQINAVIWELKYVINDLGYDYSDVAVVYPYNKKKLKNGKNIYFQYMLRKALEDAEIPYVYADYSITSITNKEGITISNIYSIKSLSYKVVIFCELEMLYNQALPEEYQDYNVNDFIGDLNKVYTAITRAEKELRIIVSYTKESSKIIDLIES